MKLALNEISHQFSNKPPIAAVFGLSVQHDVTSVIKRSKTAADDAQEGKFATSCSEVDHQLKLNPHSSIYLTCEMKHQQLDN